MSLKQKFILRGQFAFVNLGELADCLCLAEVLIFLLMLIELISKEIFGSLHDTLLPDECHYFIIIEEEDVILGVV